MIEPITEQLIDLALTEDAIGGDITSTTTIPATTRGRGTFVAKAPGVISGLDVAREVFLRVDPTVVFSLLVADGTRVEPATQLATVQGAARSLLAAERVALNLLQRLSGVATATSRYVAAVAGTEVRIVDTRKTTPGMRVLERAAVRHGGGHNHRFGLTDGVLIKDNHLAAIGGPNCVTRAIEAARRHAPHTMRVEVEVTTLAELEEALAARADIVLLDNMDVATMRQAVQITTGRALLEASGGVNLNTVGDIAATGVDIISIGALTHSSPALDISLELEIAPDSP